MDEPLDDSHSDLARALKRALMRASSAPIASLNDRSPGARSRATGDRSTPITPRSASPMSPALAYGRHRGPVGPTTRHAAVAVTLYRDAQPPESGGGNPAAIWHTILTTRPPTLRHHGGQVCFPGGRIEPGESTTEAAIREFTEELGRAPGVIAQCGTLPAQYIYASDHLVHPVVMLIHRPAQAWRPDQAEVDQVIQAPLPPIAGIAKRDSEILSRNVRREHEQVGEFTFRSPKFNIQGHSVWGATAMILAQTTETVAEA